MKYTKEISCGIIPVYQNTDGSIEILLIRSRRGVGNLGFPKGHLEKGESHLDAALRECYEEVGIIPEHIIENPYFTEKYFIKWLGIEKEVYYFLAFVEDKNVILQKEEVKNFCWVSFDEAEKKLKRKSKIELLKKIKPYIQ